MIAARYGIPITSPGAILREEKRIGSALGVEADKITSQGRLLPDETVVGLIRNWLEHHDSEFVFDGFPRSRGQADALEELLRGRGTPLDAVLALEADADTLRQRVAGRMVCQKCGNIVAAGLHVESAASPCPKCGGPLGRRSDDTPEVLAARLKEYEAKTAPLLDYYEQRKLLRRVDSARTPDLVFASIASILEES
jgi:adenylate kinase